MGIKSPKGHDVCEVRTELRFVIMVEVIKIYCDGSGFNKINSAYCFIVVDWRKRKYKCRDLKKVKVIYEDKNVYQIEYLALIGALKFCDSVEGDYKFKIYSDSKCIVKEVNLLIRPKRIKLFNESRKIMGRNRDIKVLWVPREENLAGIYLEKRLKKLNRYGKINYHQYRKK